MKKLLLLGVVMMGVLSSCVKDAASGPVDYQKAKEEAYSNAFVQAFGGKIAANQTWGFMPRMSAYCNEQFFHDDHINNFNAGTCESSAVSEKTGKTIKGMQLMVESSTQRFGFSSSLDNGHVFYNFRMEEINGNYYVGFDFEAAGQNKSEQVARDYIYNDWIVKIVPGKGQSRKVKQEGLIICEDLGNIGDFDFNDVVFYAKVWESGKTDIWLLAAGGTLDLTVAGREVHEAFGVSKSTMVNTKESTGKGAEKDPFYFVASNKYNSLIDIPVVVRTKDAAGNVTSYELSAEMGKAPQKICVPKGFKWCKEYKSLAEVYPGFKSWTTGAADTWTGTGSYDAENVCDYEFAY